MRIITVILLAAFVATARAQEPGGAAAGSASEMACQGQLVDELSAALRWRAQAIELQQQLQAMQMQRDKLLEQSQGKKAKDEKPR